jgi:hypothetical protein
MVSLLIHFYQSCDTVLTCSQEKIDILVVEEQINSPEPAQPQPGQPSDGGFGGPCTQQNDQANEPIIAANESTDDNLPKEPGIPNNDVQPSVGGKNKADDISDDDSVDEHMEAIRDRYANMEKRIQLAPKRLKQQNQYTKILEERISMLEERFALFDRKLQKPGKPFPLPPGSFPEDSSVLTSTLKPVLGFKF